MSKKLITLSVSLIAATTLVFGQQKDNSKKVTDTIKNLVEVIVTANKIEQKQNTTGKVVTVITDSQIQANAGRNLSQLLNEQAGLNLPGALSNAGTVPSIYMRGASSGRALVLIDGVPVGDPSMINNEFDLNLVPLNQVERIEILKGAQSTMYGSDAIGGVINIITKKQLKNKLSGALSLGTYDTKNANIQFSSSIKKINYSLGFENQTSDGFSSATDKTNSLNFDKDGYKNNSWFIKAQKDLNKYWNLNAYSRKTAYASSIDYGGFKDDKDNTFNNATSMSGLVLKYKKEKTSLQFQYQYTTQDRSYLNDSVDRKYLIFEDNKYKGNAHFADLFLATPLSKNIQWIIGSDFRHGAYNQTYASVSNWGPYNDAFKDTFQYQNSVYSSFLLTDNTKKWLLEIGGRFNNHSRYGNNTTYTASPSYAISSALRLQASISTGFKAPSLYQLSYNDQLKAEESFNTEIGLEYRKANLFTRLVYYNRVIDNGIDYNYIDYNYFNFIQQKVNGLELETNYVINSKHSLSFNYTLMNGQETNQNRVTTTDTITYNYLLKRPKHSTNIKWSYTNNKKWATTLTARYISSRFDVGGYATEDVKLGDYTLLNAHVQYKCTKGLTFFADAQNILNNQFQEINGYNTIGKTFCFGIRLN